MAETDYNYSGSSAYKIYQSFVSNATEAKKAYDKAVEDWNSVQTYLSVTGSKEKMDNISEFHSGEIAKVISNIEDMKTSLGNVDQSWQDVSSAINTALDNYYKKDEE